MSKTITIPELIEKALVPSINKLVKEFSDRMEKAHGVVVGADITWVWKKKEDKNEEGKDGSDSKE